MSRHRTPRAAFIGWHIEAGSGSCNSKHAQGAPPLEIPEVSLLDTGISCTNSLTADCSTPYQRQMFFVKNILVFETF
ncbi:hypothetical protein J6590_016242 [Homalodisca vitripennis]|nr:hypothetical protein J6590_016242 [Homalodisca vitripennis]